MVTDGLQEAKTEKRSKAAVLFVPAGLLIGIGIGFAVGNLPAAMFVGLGIGLLLWALVVLFRR